jgi:hypothetical protein
VAEKSPAAWLETLEHRLHHRWNEWKSYDDYYEGNHRLAFASRTYRNRFGTLLAHLVSNWMPLIVDSSAERIRVQGLRFGDQADDEIWDIWQANGLDAQANMVHTEAIKLGEAYWLVQPTRDVPKITCEHPSQVIVATDPADSRNRLAALKKWQEDDGTLRANVYLPDRVVKYQAKRDPVVLAEVREKDKWRSIGAERNPLGVVPIIPMPNNPTMLGGGVSDLARGKLAIQDAINKMLGDSQVSSESHALPQRVLLGVEPPRNPTTGRVVTDQQMAESQIWYFNTDKAQAHEFSAGDMKQLRELVDGQIGDLASQTRTPVHYFKPQSISNLSAEALQGLETGLVSKVRDKQDPFGDGYEELARLAFRSIDPDDPRGSETNIEVIWKDPESRSMAQVVDAAVKKAQIGVPWEQIMTDIGYSPPEIDRMAAMRATDALLTEATQPEVPVAEQSPQRPPN